MPGAHLKWSMRMNPLGQQSLKKKSGFQTHLGELTFHENMVQCKLHIFSHMGNVASNVSTKLFESVKRLLGEG